MEYVRMGQRKIEKIAIVFLTVTIQGAEILLAQSVEDDIREENLLESVLTNFDDAPDLFTPIDINRASEEELLSIPGMSAACASSIVGYRKRNRSIHSFEDLSQIEGMTPDIMSMLKRSAVIEEDNRIRADATSYFTISPQRLSVYDDAYGEYGILNFQRLSFSYRNLEGYAVTDKDPGEQSYLDFYSLAFVARGVLGFSTVNAGDYTVSLGNGLLFSSGGMVSKTAGAITPLFATRAYFLGPYRSKGENKFLRGAAFAVPVGRFGITAFVSAKDLSARVDTAGSVTSIDYSGLNLPASASRKKLRERIAGGIVHYDTPTVTGGVSAVYFSYDYPFRDYYSKDVLAVESFARLRMDQIVFSGEALFDRLISFSSNVSFDYGDARFAVGIRNLRSKIVQNYSGPLSESFPTNPEQGVYFGTTLRPLDIVKLGFYYDRFRINSTSGEPERNGEEIFVDSYISFSKMRIFESGGTVLYLRYKYKTKEDPYVPFVDVPTALSVIAGSKQNLRIDLKHRFAEVFSVRARVERNFLSSGEKGEMLLFDCGWRTEDAAIDARVCFYRTDSYKSAFYTVEKDLPHVAEFTLFYGDGARLFLLGSWKLNDSFSVGTKVSREIYSGDREMTVGPCSAYEPGVTDLSLEFSYSLGK